MPFNSNYGNWSKPFKASPYTQDFEKIGSPLPPPPTTRYVVDASGNFVVTASGQNVIYPS